MRGGSQVFCAGSRVSLIVIFGLVWGFVLFEKIRFGFSNLLVFTVPYITLPYPVFQFNTVHLFFLISSSNYWKVSRYGNQCGKIG